jgi:Tol biopolymer transport system component
MTATLILAGFCLLISALNLAIARQNDPQEWLYFADASGGLFRMFPNGSHVETLIENMIVDERILWSENGQWLYFSGYDYAVGPPMLYRFDVYHQQLEPLMESGGRPRPWSWSPDGEWLLVNESYGAGLNYLVLMRPDGSDTHSPIPDVSYSLILGWSPDSQWLLFEASYESASDLYVVRPDGSDFQNLTQPAEAAAYNGWITSDGEWIIYISDQLSDTDIFRMRWDGSDQHNLTTTPERAEQVVNLSPDGEWIVYESFVDRVQYLYRSRIDGRDELQLTDFDTIPSFNPYSTRWSPDGAWLYLEAGQAHESEIFRVHIASGEIEQLTDNGVSDFFQQLSSDGQWLIITSGLPDVTTELRALDVETGQSTLLASFPFWMETGDFSPDGDWYYFTRPDDNLSLQLYRVRLDGTDLEQIADSAGDKSFLTWSQQLEET